MTQPFARRARRRPPLPLLTALLAVAAVASLTVVTVPAFGQTQPPPAAGGTAERPRATPQQVDAALKKGAAWLWAQQKEDGRWEKDAHREGIGHDFANQQGT